MISAELMGRLGNNLFQYAVARTTAQGLGCSFCISPSREGEGEFPQNLYPLQNDPFELPPYSRQPLEFREGLNAFNEGVNAVNEGTHLIGFWQSEKYFSHNAKNVRSWLMPTKPSTPPPNPEHCVIHLRAQDAYLSNNYILPRQYFENARNYISRKFGVTNFTIITDNEELAEEWFPTDFIASACPKEAFMLLCHAPYKILSNSSFGWWAGWLRLKESRAVIAPNKWMNHNGAGVNFENLPVAEDSFYPFDIKTTDFIYL